MRTRNQVLLWRLQRALATRPERVGAVVIEGCSEDGKLSSGEPVARIDVGAEAHERGQPAGEWFASVEVSVPLLPPPRYPARQQVTIDTIERTWAAGGGARAKMSTLARELIELIAMPAPYSALTAHLLREIAGNLIAPGVTHQRGGG
jgi:hypothetical protein